MRPQGDIHSAVRRYPPSGLIRPADMSTGETAGVPDYIGGTVLRLRAMSWTGVAAKLIDIRCRERVEAELTSNSPRLSAIVEQLGGRIGVSASRNGLASPSFAGKGISIVPASCEAWACGSDVRFVRHLVLDFNDQAMEAILGEPVDLDRALGWRLQIADERLSRLCRLFSEELTDDEPVNRLFGDGLSVALIRRLASIDTPGRTKPKNSGLAPWQLRRVTDYLSANLGKDTSIDVLAAMTSLSPSYFSRAFKTTTGTPPYQWLLSARCERAKQLMMETDSGLADIALQVGCYDQAHFSRLFAKTVGVSPNAWRRERSA